MAFTSSSASSFLVDDDDDDDDAEPAIVCDLLPKFTVSMPDVTTFDEEKPPPPSRGGRSQRRRLRHCNPTSNHNFKHDEDMAPHHRFERNSRLDPPARRPRNPSTPRRSSAMKQPDRDASALPPVSRGRKPSEARSAPDERDEHRRRHRQRRHERRRGRTARGSQRPRESSRTRSPRRGASEAEGPTVDRGHPALSSSFQVRPHQLLQVYKDLHEKHREPNANRSPRKCGGADEASPGNDGMSRTRDLKSKFQAAPSGSFSCESSSEHEEPVDGGGGTNCLAVYNMKTPKATSRNRPPKDGFPITSILKKASIGTATTASASETKGLDNTDHGVDDKGDCKVITTDVVDAAQQRPTASSSKTRQYSSDRGSIEHRSNTRSYASEPTLTTSNELLTLPLSIDSRLLQKQISYLQNEPDETSLKRTDRQVIIYCSKEPPTLPLSLDREVRPRQIKLLQNESAATTPKSTDLVVYRRRRPKATKLEAFNEIRRETQRRQEISHRRGSTRKSNALMFREYGRRCSFS